MRLATAATLFLALAAAPARATNTVPPPLVGVSREQLCVSNGAITTGSDGQLVIETPSAGARLLAGTAQSAELHFRFWGPSAIQKPLATGERRRQIGLKLLAEDGCNLVTALWHIAPDHGLPDHGLHVLLKRNPASHTSQQCGARGTVEMKPETAKPLPKIHPGEDHILGAELAGGRLTVRVDRTVVWQGALGDAIAGLAGPVGLRTDNVHIDFEFFTPSGNANAASTASGGHCVPSPND